MTSVEKMSSLNCNLLHQQKLLCLFKAIGLKLIEINVVNAQLIID